MTGRAVASQCDSTICADDLLSLVDDLAALGTGGHPASDADLVDRIRALERVKRAAAAAQARLSVAFDDSRREQQELAGVPAAEVGRGVADQVALARMESPHRGGQHLGLAKALVTEMPFTLAALTRGDVSEWGATVMARETAVLTAEHRREVDARLGESLSQPGVSEKQLGDMARAIAYELDAQAAVARSARAEADRCVTIRPAPDTMVYLTAHLPVGAGVGAYASLDAAARAAAAAGDPRSRGQVMADTLVGRLTGSTSCTGADVAGEELRTSDPDPAPPPAAGVTVNLVMCEATLFGEDDAPATVVGYGPVPAGWARDLLARAAAADAAWLRRLWRRPGDGQLVGLDSRSRLFPTGLAQLIRLRDQVCSTPWCDAPIRHVDHVVPWSGGGSTSYENGQGLCEHCNLVKEDAGFTTERAGSRTTITTPTGHVYEGTAPPLLGVPPPRAPGTTDTLVTTRPSSVLEQRMRQLIDAA